MYNTLIQLYRYSVCMEYRRKSNDHSDRQTSKKLLEIIVVHSNMISNKL